MTDTKDAANNEMYSAFGRATTAWQHVEDGLCDLFNRIVICSIAGSMRSAPRAFFLTGNIFYSFTNLRSRLVMMDNLIEGTITDANLAGEWNAIKNKVLRIYKYRNTMAHSHVWGNEIQGLTTLRPSICKKCKKNEPSANPCGGTIVPKNRRTHNSLRDCRELSISVEH